MKNFIFKSANREQTDLYKILTQLNLLLTEQRQQRIDLSKITKLLKGLIGEFIKDPEYPQEELDAQHSDTEQRV